MSKVESAESIIATANSYFVDEDYDTALVKFNEAIDLDNSNSDYFAKRSFCQFKLDNFTEAMADAKKGIALDPQNPRAHFRKGMAAFSLEEFESAKEAFEKAQQLAPSAQHKTWIRKCEAELADGDKDGADESSEDMDIVKPPQTTVKQTHQLDGPPPLEPDTKQTKKSPVDDGLPPPLEPDVPLKTTNPAPSPAPVQQQPGQSQSKVRYEWYQTETHVSVSIFLKNVKKEDANIVIKPESLSVEVKLPTSGSEYQLNIGLSDKVIPEESSTSILGSKIEIKMKKTRTAKWPSLENSGGQIQSWDIVADNKPEKGLSYPSSSKHGSKDWDALSREQPDEKLEGEAALNKVFADIYKGASDEQRMAMQKSFQESGGTVLSTNWDEVGKGEVKGHPPKGMDMHQWKELHT